MKGLCSLGRDEGEPFDQPDTPQVAMRRELWGALGDPVEHRDILGQELLVICTSAGIKPLGLTWLKSPCQYPLSEPKANRMTRAIDIASVGRGTGNSARAGTAELGVMDLRPAPPAWALRRRARASPPSACASRAEAVGWRVRSWRASSTAMISPLLGVEAVDCQKPRGQRQFGVEWNTVPAGQPDLVLAAVALVDRPVVQPAQRPWPQAGQAQPWPQRS